MSPVKHLLVSLSLILTITIVLLLQHKSGIKEYNSNKDFSNIMTNLQQGLIDEGYEIEKVQPIDNGLAKAGLTIKKYKVIFFNPKYTLNAIQKKYPAFSALLPLSITVAKEKDNIKIVSSPFKFLASAAHGQDLLALVNLWKRQSNKIIIKALKESEDAFKLENKSASLSTSVNIYH